jgi:hypothetical protein
LIVNTSILNNLKKPQGALVVMSRFIRTKTATMITLALLLAEPMVATAQHYPELSDARIAEIATMLPEKPVGFGRPCTDRTAWEQVAHNYSSSVEKAETLIASPLPAWDDEKYALYSKTGDRKIGEAMMRAHDEQLGPLVLAECSEWKGRFLPRIEEELDAIAAQASWVEPAHRVHAVDLNAAGLGHEVAEALYLLGDELPAVTRQRSMEGLEKNVFASMHRSLSGIHPDSWLRVHSNWNSVCLDGTVGAALAILPDRSERALYVAAAEHFSPNYLVSFKDSGYDEEGIGYWVYGFSNYEELREELWLATNGKIDLFDDAKARKAALFGFQFAMLPGVYAPFADAHFGGSPDPALLATIDRIFHLGMTADAAAARTSLFDRALPVAVLAGFPIQSDRKDAGGTAAAEIIGLRTNYDDAGILVDRPASRGTLAITIKAGGNGPHSHNDIGAYSIGLGTTQPVGDPGGPSFYTADTFSDKRLESRLLNSFGHPVPEIDGNLQLDATKVKLPLVSTSFSPDEDTITMDITAAYADSNLHQLVRTMHFFRKDGGSIVIEDQFDLGGPAEIVESLPTHGSYRQIDARTLEFDLEDAHLQVTIDAPSPFVVTEDKVDDYGTAFTRVGLKMHLAKSGKVAMRLNQVSAP